MTPWLRTLHVTGLLLVLMTGAVPLSYAAEPAPSADASRAGSVAGQGRVRPGRAEPTGPDTADDTGEAEPTDAGRDPAVPDRQEASAAAEPSGNAVIPVQQNAVVPPPAPEPVLQILPLGSGLILMGLGLGLAFVALRVRRR
ncbi:hypothetical protein GCM10011579_036870 [Streptomyces albiflavescens]|uniref:Gram-positive cocci surface proteins LPxTG domain-containing protein n=1 Tax=Streptomyces albiflavescens TaxID=1623582 RepID=A0A918D4X4_9ACTN|nr:hypothetical protein [Streptomyces albiflavescens]GGN65870.1 hypothetical protein GCM10011579_036870 [Streptomyces albiflavescens]